VEVLKSNVIVIVFVKIMAYNNFTGHYIGWRPLTPKYWALSVRPAKTSLLFYVSCHQSYRVSLSLIDPVSFLNPSLLYLP